MNIKTRPKLQISSLRKKPFTFCLWINKLRLILLMWTLIANKNISYLIIFLFILTIGCNEKPKKLYQIMDGYNMLLIGTIFLDHMPKIRKRSH